MNNKIEGISDILGFKYLLQESNKKLEKLIPENPDLRIYFEKIKKLLDMKCLEKVTDFIVDMEVLFNNIWNVLNSNISGLQYLILAESRFFQIQTHIFSSSDKQICFDFLFTMTITNETTIATYEIRNIIFNTESKKESFIYRKDIGRSRYYRVNCRTGLKIEISLIELMLKVNNHGKKTYVH